MVEGRLGRRYTLYLFSWMGKAHGKEASYNRWQVSEIREPSWTAQKQGLEMHMVSLHEFVGRRMYLVLTCLRL